MTVRRDLPGLLGAGLVLAAVFAVATARIPLWRYFPGDQGITLDFTKMLGADIGQVTRQYIGVVLASFTAYAASLILVWRMERRPPAWVLFGVPALCALVLLSMYPPTAVDMFHYHAASRVFWIYDANPLTVPPGNFPYPIGYSWAGQPSPYGPLWSILGGLVTVPAQDHYLAALYGFKVLAALSLLACSYLTWRLVERRWPGEGALAVVLLAWNPFVLLRVVGNGHNDLVMMAFVLLALELTERRRWRWAFAALACSALVKFITVLLFPLFLAYCWQHAASTVRGRWRAVLEGCAVMAVMAITAFVPFWVGIATFDTVRGEADKMITSTALAIGVAITGAPEEVDVNRAILLVLRIVFVGLAALVWWQSRRDFPRLIVACFTVLTLYLFLAGGWFRPWYLLWPVSIAALRPRSWMTPMLLAITLAGSFPDLVEQYRGE